MKIYKTKSGSTAKVYRKTVHIDFDWMGEGACLDCNPYFDEKEILLEWNCVFCDGGKAELELVSDSDISDSDSNSTIVA